MKSVICKVLALALCLSLLPMYAAAEETAADISKSTAITATGYGSTGFLTDGDIKTYKTSNGNAVLTLENEEGMAGLYLLFDLEYGKYTIKDNTSGKTMPAGAYGMLHEYIDLVAAFGAMPTSVSLLFENGKVRLSEISVFGQGELPENVQVWNAPHEGGADLVLFASHGDDDQLFFAGLLPLYAGEKGLRVQVVYLTDHRNLTHSRTHEMLNGLWNVGVTAYPVFGDFADFRIDDLEDTYDEYARLGTSREELQSFVVEQIRRFRPLVAVGHDINGEYGHGMHMVYADLLINALDLTGVATEYPESAEKYGTWELQKLYLHLYEENPVTIDYDQPLESFNGMTAFEVTQKKGYPCHESQQWTWFTGWINGKNTPITKATEIATYNPCKFGLYHSTVGDDVAKNDFMENIVDYAEQERLELERLEQERLEQERLEQERLEQQKKEEELLEQERKEKEEQARLEQERLEAEKLMERDKKTRTVLIICCGVAVALLAVVLLISLKKKRRHRRRRK